MQKYLSGQKIGDFVGEFGGIVGHDAFNQQRERIKRRAEVFEGLIVLSERVETFQLFKHGVIGIEFEDLRRFEHWIIHCRESFFH